MFYTKASISFAVKCCSNGRIYAKGRFEHARKKKLELFANSLILLRTRKSPRTTFNFVSLLCSYLPKKITIKVKNILRQCTGKQQLRIASLQKFVSKFLAKVKMPIVHYNQNINKFLHLLLEKKLSALKMHNVLICLLWARSKTWYKDIFRIQSCYQCLVTLVWYHYINFMKTWKDLTPQSFSEEVLVQV